MSAAASPWIQDVAQADFERDVIERSRQLPVVVDFWAPWCAPCRMLGPLLEQLIAQRNGAVVLAKVNVDAAQDLAARYYISGIPAVKAFRDGKPVLEFEGVLPESQLRAFLDRIVPTEADRLAKEAAALELSKPAEAEQLYCRAIAQDPRHEAALIGLARVLVEHGKDAEAEELLGGTGFGEPYAADAERLQGILYLRRRAREFGDEPTARRRLAAQPENAERRYELGCALAAAGNYPEALAHLLAAAEQDPKLATSKVREVMVKVFYVVGVRSALADDFRDKLSRVLY